ALENYDAMVSPVGDRARGFTLLFGPGDYHFSDGPGSNGILFSAVHSRVNGRWGFYDNSELGCPFVAFMTHTNGLNAPNGGSYKVADARACSVLIGCYAEIDQRNAEVSPLTLVFGGAMEVDTAGPTKGQHLDIDGTGVLNLAIPAWAGGF